MHDLLLSIRLTMAGHRQDPYCSTQAQSQVADELAAQSNDVTNDFDINLTTWQA